MFPCNVLSMKISNMNNIRVKSNPPVELLRCRAWKKCRTRLKTSLSQVGCDSRRGWIRVFERWQLICKLSEDLDSSEIPKDHQLDPLIPTLDTKLSHSILIAELTALDGMDSKRANSVADGLIEYAKNMASGVTKLEDQVSVDAPGVGTVSIKSKDEKLRKWNSESHSITETDMNTIEMYMGTTQQVFPLTRDAFGKLSKAWQSNNHHTIPKQEFLNDLFCLLVRYHALEGWGNQAAITPGVFTCLSNTFGVNTECFASALNHVLPNYHSMFPDLEIGFGSSGSFFNIESFNPDEGSFEANPPFVQILMLEMLFKMHRLLQKATGPMSFAVIVPAWTDEESWMSLCASPYLTHEPIVIQASDHSYADGSGYRRADWDGRARPAPFNTAVFFLQNEKGKEKWPLNESTEASLRQAFKSAVPDENLVKRQVKEGLYVPKKKRNQVE